MDKFFQYSERNDQIEKFSNEDAQKKSLINSNATTAMLTFFTVVTIGSAPIQHNLNQPSIHFSNDRSTKTAFKSVGFNSLNNYDIIELEGDFTDGEVIPMTDVTHKDMLEQERHLLSEIDKKISVLSTDIKNTLTKIDAVDEKVNAIESSLKDANAKIDNLPIAMKASRWDSLLDKLVAPVVTGLIIGVVIYLLGMN